MYTTTRYSAPNTALAILRRSNDQSLPWVEDWAWGRSGKADWAAWCYPPSHPAMRTGISQVHGINGCPTNSGGGVGGQCPIASRLWCLVCTIMYVLYCAQRLCKALGLPSTYIVHSRISISRLFPLSHNPASSIQCHARRTMPLCPDIAEPSAALSAAVYCPCCPIMPCNPV